MSDDRSKLLSSRWLWEVLSWSAGCHGGGAARVRSGRRGSARNGAARAGRGGCPRASVRRCWGPAAGRWVDCPEGRRRTPSRSPPRTGVPGARARRPSGSAAPAKAGILAAGEPGHGAARGGGAWPGPEPSWLGGAGPGGPAEESRGLGSGSGARLGVRGGHGSEVRASVPARSGSCAASDRAPGPVSESGAVTDPRCGPRCRRGRGVARPRIGVPSRHGSEVRAAASARRAGEAATDAP